MGHRYLTIRPREGLFYRGRPGTPRIVIVHCTQGDTAEGAARWWQNPAAGGSAHVVVDDEVVVRAVDDGDVAYHCKGANTYGLGLEICGWAHWTREQWLSHEPRLKEAARIHAGWCRAYSIPFVWSQVAGYHSHDGMPGNDHTDPGEGFPWDSYRGWVQAYLDGGAIEDGRPFGASLRVSFPDGRTYGGWTKEEAAYDGPALGALRWVARQTPERIRRGTVIRWKGGTFDTPRDLPMVARTILNRTGGK